MVSGYFFIRLIYRVAITHTHAWSEHHKGVTSSPQPYHTLPSPLMSPHPPSPPLPSSPSPFLCSTYASNGHATPSKGGLEVLGVLHGRLFVATPSKSFTQIGGGDVELSIVQNKGEAFLTFFLTVQANGKEVSGPSACVWPCVCVLHCV